MTEETKQATFAVRVDMLRNLLGIAAFIATLVGAAYVSLYRINELEAKVIKVEERFEEVGKKLDEKADTTAIEALKADLKSIRRTLGNIQIDTALMCTLMSKQAGGNPLTDCRTSNGGRSQ